MTVVETTSLQSKSKAVKIDVHFPTIAKLGALLAWNRSLNKKLFLLEKPNM